MHILHYTLGFQPYRSGGLVRYAADLMQMQASMGHKIFCLVPRKYVSYNAQVSYSVG